MCALIVSASVGQFTIFMFMFLLLVRVLLPLYFNAFDFGSVFACSMHSRNEAMLVC